MSFATDCRPESFLSRRPAQNAHQSPKAPRATAAWISRTISHLRSPCMISLPEMDQRGFRVSFIAECETNDSPAWSVLSVPPLFSRIRMHPKDIRSMGWASEVGLNEPLPPEREKLAVCPWARKLSRRQSLIRCPTQGMCMTRQRKGTGRSH